MLRGNHTPEGRPVKHYIDYVDDSGNIKQIGPKPADEMAVDNNRRPGRYLMLQRVEMLPEASGDFGTKTIKSSLGLAREWKEKVGSMKWSEYAEQLGSAA
jgi:hypothetical protein